MEVSKVPFSLPVSTFCILCQYLLYFQPVLSPLPTSTFFNRCQFSCEAQWEGEENKADRGRGGKTTSGNGQAWSSVSPRGQWKTGGNGETGCKIICDAPKTLSVEGLMMMMVLAVGQTAMLVYREIPMGGMGRTIY